MRGLKATCVLFLTASCGAATDPPEPRPGDIASAIDDALRGLGTGSTTENEIAYRVFDLRDTTLAGSITPESCDSVDQALDDTCGRILDADQADGCSRDTTFYYAHSTPRCAVRLTLHSYTNTPYLPWIYALDFTGTPLDRPEPLCGNGALDDGEQCDDGNFELWDGCDSTCRVEEFNGCETVIEQIYAGADLARVDATTWEAKRSQLMVNDATAMQPVTAATCQEAGDLIAVVCGELDRQMPFVGGCSGNAHYDASGAAPVCAVRINVYFATRDPAAGVFTTALGGILTFTIR